MDISFVLYSLGAFLLGFTILVFIHEWGHYATARLFGARVEVFSIGFGKEIVGWTAKSGTRWRISMIPLGGYVKFFGDASVASNPGEHVDGLSDQDKAECLHYKPIWQRAAVAAAGPIVNLIVPVFVFAAFFFSYGQVLVDPVIETVQEDSAAARAGFLKGDIIVAVNDREITHFTEVRQEVMLQPGGPMSFDVVRQGQRMTLNAVIDKRYQEDRFGNQYATGYLGVGPTGTYSVKEFGPIGALGAGAVQTKNSIHTMLRNIGQLILGMRSIKEIKGPVGMAQIMGDAASRSVLDWIQILAMLSLSLGIMNLMPIPVLDGGHLVFYALEAIKGGPVSKFAQEAGFIAGLALVLFLMVVVTLNDLQSLAS